MKITMLDKSIYEEKDTTIIKAIKMRIKNDKRFTGIFIADVAYHYAKKTIPTKFGPGFDEKWTKNYKDHAELASKVLYVYIRAILMGMAFEKLGGGSVIALNNKGGATVYPQNKEYKNINNAIKATENKTNNKKNKK